MASKDAEMLSLRRSQGRGTRLGLLQKDGVGEPPLPMMSGLREAQKPGWDKEATESQMGQWTGLKLGKEYQRHFTSEAFRDHPMKTKH